MLVLAAFLFEWRTALISLVAIPLSLVAGTMVLIGRGATLNTMILAGFVIAIGVVVDDAIIDVENIVETTATASSRRSKRSTAVIVLEASLEVRQAIIHATLIDAVVLLPRVLHGRRVGRVLPAHGGLVWARGAGLDGRRTHHHPRPVPC
jgi:Cu/Ag efflux pump CusA